MSKITAAHDTLAKGGSGLSAVLALPLLARRDGGRMHVTTPFFRPMAAASCCSCCSRSSPHTPELLGRIAAPMAMRRATNVGSALETAPRTVVVLIYNL